MEILFTRIHDPQISNQIDAADNVSEAAYIVSRHFLCHKMSHMVRQLTGHSL